MGCIGLPERARWVSLALPLLLIAKNARKAFPSQGLSFPIYKMDLAWTLQSGLFRLCPPLHLDSAPLQSFRLISKPWGWQSPGLSVGGSSRAWHGGF